MIKIEDFKEGGSKRKYITHTGVLPEIDCDILSDEQKVTLLGKCYTMCDGYIVQPTKSETIEDEVGKTEGEGTGETGETEGEGTDEVEETEGEGTDEVEETEGEGVGETGEKSQDEGISTLK